MWVLGNITDLGIMPYQCQNADLSNCGDPNSRFFVCLIGKSYQCSELRTAMKTHQNWHIHTLSDMSVSENVTDIVIMPWRCRHADMYAPYCKEWSYNLIWYYASNCCLSPFVVTYLGCAVNKSGLRHGLRISYRKPNLKMFTFEWSKDKWKLRKFG